MGAAAGPRFLSDVNLATNERWNFSPALAAAEQVFLSYEVSEFLEGVVPPNYVAPAPTVSFDPSTGKYVTNAPPSGSWVQRHYLQVVDYADPAHPTERRPVNLPGALRGLAHQGELLYTVGPHFDLARWNTEWVEWLDASAYDGVAAHRIDSLQLSKLWPHPLSVWEEHVLLGRPDENGNGGPLLETWSLSAAGRFERVGFSQLTTPAQSFLRLGQLLAVQTGEAVNLYDATQPAALGLLKATVRNGCLGFDLGWGDGSLSRGLWLPLYDYGVAHFHLP